ncbi:hypothetical protein RJ639_002110 [Escallonia herrerae]|uniref:Uncharacterized protein n=1 Tax=Escallonia herrerae TaxID=1293975 RepID=A0AA89BTS0_9ASTE|nr:hypothetical protein RJ639_002110 [Escallonia herrerae]
MVPSTIAYMSPERINTDTYGGLYNGFPLAVAVGGDWASLVSGEVPEAPLSASPEFRDFIGGCLSRDSAKSSYMTVLIQYLRSRADCYQGTKTRDTRSLSKTKLNAYLVIKSPLTKSIKTSPKHTPDDGIFSLNQLLVLIPARTTLSEIKFQYSNPSPSTHIPVPNFQTSDHFS